MRPILLAVVVATVIHRVPAAIRVHASSHVAPPAEVAPSVDAAASTTPCPDILDIDAERLAAGWPKMIGQRVRLPMRIDRAVDFTIAIGVSGKHRFSLLLSPAATWTGTVKKVFVVTGSRTVHSGGRLVLPELLVDDGSCDG
jgi:hypothetical protein